MWTITRLENLSGVYVECYRFSIFVVTDSVYNIPPITSVHQTTLQIGAVKVLLPSVNEYKNY